ncbi:hypothetical protein WR25_15823 [Diploscapter pachys]|uniref:Craniofacial development protein 1 n=1 Tax=Diploscapter pachys TaxID=2018661 RepID=A0A2A2JJ72_9BILA|nr:hypothetical protein WR25_15823 [Diploscapter pachys]
MSGNDEDDYRSSEDEDYVPEDVNDVSEPSEDEGNEEPTGEGDESVKKPKRKNSKKKNSKAKNGADEENNVVAPSSAYSSVDVDAIFAELIGDDLPSSKKSNEPKNVEKVTGEKKEENISASTSSEPSEGVTTSKMTTVTEVFDFAGDEVRVEREVTEEEKLKFEEKERKKEKPQKRMGLTGALTMLAKKPKMSVLDKSNLDWNSFKKEEKIEEELSTFNKGKQGYLNKVEFLNRADQREYEQEKAFRNAKRN